MTARTALLTLALAGATALTGCYSIGGVPASRDRYFYESTPHLPATVSVLDTRTGEVVWSIDVPVGRKLGLQFFDDRRPDGATEARPSMMRWRVGALDESIGSLDNEIAVPNATARKLHYEVREGPEFAQGPATFPAADLPPNGETQQPAAGVAEDLEPIDPAPAGDDSPPDLEPIVVEDDR
ncbi:MAG: hypothetical protein ACTS22_00645 [Phycisphaerales bacterium]